MNKTSLQNALTLVNPQNGHLAFKIYSFSNTVQFDHIQRLNYYSLLLITEGESRLKVDFSEYAVPKNTLLCFSPYQPFMLFDSKGIKGQAIHFHSDFFCIHKHHHEVACHGVLFNNIYDSPLVKLTVQDVKKSSVLFTEIKEEIMKSALAQYEVIVSYLKIFLINASRIKAGQSPGAAKVLKNAKEPFILQRLKDAIEQNYKIKHAPKPVR